MTFNNIFRLFPVAILCSASAFIGLDAGFIRAKALYEPSEQERRWLEVYADLDTSGRNGFLHSGLVYPNKTGGVTIWGYGMKESGGADLSTAIDKYCAEIKERAYIKP